VNIADGDTLVLTALKRAEDGDGLILRFYEWAGRSGTAHIRPPVGVVGASTTDLMERADKASALIKDGAVSLSYTPFSIDTLKVSFPAP
jgi:alpha-mannosidase